MRSGTLVTLLLSAALAGPARAAEPSLDHRAMAHLDGQPYGMLSVHLLEYGDSDDGDTLRWDVEAWYGGDYRKLRFETEGHGPADGRPETTELALLYDRLFSPFWSWQGGVRYDIHAHGRPDVAYAVLGVQGLAPHWFETDVALHLSEHGDLSLRAELEYDLRLTQRLILQPRLEADFSASDVPEIGTGSGLASSELGVRLRYEIRRELAPYLGVRRERLHGETGDFARAAGRPTSSTSVVVGIRAWL